MTLFAIKSLNVNNYDAHVYMMELHGCGGEDEITYQDCCVLLLLTK